MESSVPPAWSCAGVDAAEDDFYWDEAAEAELQAIEAAYAAESAKRRRLPDWSNTAGPVRPRRNYVPAAAAAASPSSVLPPPTCRGNVQARLQQIAFSGKVVYCRTHSEVEKATAEIVRKIERMNASGPVSLGFDLEWRPFPRRGEPPSKVALMQLCVDKTHCYLMHIIHSGVPPILKSLLEDSSSVKVGVCIDNDARKMFNDYDVHVQPLMDLSIIANVKLAGPQRRWSLAALTEMITSKEELVQTECQRWARKGVNIKYEIRDNRRGYKAGALKEGMKHGYVRDCDFVAIFDADFQPEPDFLRRAMPFFIHNPEIALVQGRWRFVNANECLMTRMQEMSLDYHFKVEQEVGSSMYAFFGFNGTAGVWRISALNEAGGWKDRTTVEDMDLAVRASLKGWKFVYLGDLMVKSELPSTFKAFRYQQHRWSCGPANLFRKMFMEIVRNKKVTLRKKIYVIYNFFFVRKIIGHILTSVFYCLVIPATVFVPEIEIPRWGYVYIPSIITLLNAVGTPRSIHLVIFWVLFENVMSLHRTKATFIGLLEAGRVNEWVVTEKLGDILKMKLPSKASKKLRARISERLQLLELGVSAYIFFCGCYDILFGKGHYYIFLFMQSIAFFIVGVGYVGTLVPN